MCKEVCQEVPAAKALFDEASEILGYDLLQRCTDGPKELLDSTEVSQPAIFVASMAAVEKLRQEQGEDAVDAATCAMGLSLGEYSALCFADAISFADGVKITKARGEAMQAASDAADSGMVSVIGLSKDKVAELCAAASEKSGEKIQIANYLCNGNYAVSGSSKACDVVAEIAKPEFGARMTVKLAVAGAFHTDFMAPAVSALKEVLAEVKISKPRIPIISNVDAKPHSDPDTIKKLLATQVTSPVLWENTMDSVLSKGFERAVELGPGKVTAGILKRFDKTAECTNVEV
jgi:[acyl-carrier-protein] S-malonyltransferase